MKDCRRKRFYRLIWRDKICRNSRACLKNHFRNLQAPLCGIFYPHSVAVARYAALIRIKSPTNWDSQLTKSLFQTRSSLSDTGKVSADETRKEQETKEMNTFWILMEQIELFVVYLVIGMILVRTGVLNDKGLDWIARVVMKLSLPTMIFVNVVSQVDRSALVKSLSIIGLAVTASILLFGLGVLLTKLFHIEGDRSQIYRAMTMFGNVGFMGIPIITNIFPKRGMLYVSVFTIVDQLAMWTVGVKLTSPSGKGKFNPKKLINPATVAIALAVLFVLTGLKLPGVLQTGFQNIGATATPLAMIYLGGVFACMDIRKYVRQIELYGIVICKMLLFPVLFYLALGFVSVSEEIRMTMSLITAMPTMSSVVMLANSSGSDGEYSLGGVMVTTLCGIVTLPVVCRVLLWIAAA